MLKLKQIGAGVLLLGLSFSLLAQNTTIKGKITDAENGDGLPFVNVVFKGTSIGTTTDFEGYFTLQSASPTDSISVSYIGYETKTKAIQKGATQTINFQLTSGAFKLDEIEVVAGENPAWAIMRKVIKSKKDNDIRNLEAYNYESYSKIEIDIDNMSDKFRQKKILRPITSIFDSLQLIAGEDGKPILPIFISEAISDYFFVKTPKRTKEKVKASNITGIGMDDGTFLSQVIGPTFQQYNFYENWLKILGKSFISPIATGWKGYYDYYLVDSMNIGEHFCYKMEIEPKRKEDLAFWGTIWIDKASYALKQIDVHVDKSANLNYIEGIKIQQELAPTSANAWIPVKNRILIDAAELNNNWAGVIAKFYTSNKDIEVNNIQPDAFYIDNIEVVHDAQKKDEQFWQENRHDTLTQTEIAVFNMVDSVRNLPIIKTYVDIAYFIVNGYHTIGKIELGPYITTYANNDVEGHRFRIGLRTNEDFSTKLIISGYGAYGTLDEEFKYKGEIRYIPSKKPWVEMGARYKHDLVQLGIFGQDRNDDGVFNAFVRWGHQKQPFMITELQGYFQKDVFKGFNQRIEFSNRIYDPRYGFSYFSKLENGDRITVLNGINTSEITLESRYAHKERFLYLDNQRISLGTKKWPIFKLRFTMGLPDIMDSQFEYHKLQLGVDQKLRIGSFGTSSYEGTIGKIFSAIPYPLLNVHLGNETPFYNSFSFNLMNYLEFVTDQYITMRFAHHFEGQLLNRIPLLKRLKWRALANANILYGTVSDANLDLLTEVDEDRNPIENFYQIQGYKPYIEFGYGIENILKIIRVEAFHRLTYTFHPNANNFGVKFALQFKL